MVKKRQFDIYVFLFLYTNTTKTSEVVWYLLRKLRLLIQYIHSAVQSNQHQGELLFSFFIKLSKKNLFSFPLSRRFQRSSANYTNFISAFEYTTVKSVINTSVEKIWRTRHVFIRTLICSTNDEDFLILKVSFIPE